MNKKAITFPLISIFVLSMLFTSCEKEEETEDAAAAAVEMSGTYTDIRDGKSYDWIRIGEQAWMTKNLALKIDTGGCWAYNNEESKADTFGYLYRWDVANAVVPAGWHLPSEEEWLALKSYLADKGYKRGGQLSKGISKSLASKDHWNESTTEGAPGNSDFSDIQNISGFSAVPGGKCYLLVGMGTSRTFSRLGEDAIWWSSTADDDKYAYSFSITYKMPTDAYSSGSNSKSAGYSVRCIKD